MGDFRLEDARVRSDKDTVAKWPADETANVSDLSTWSSSKDKHTSMLVISPPG
jgi:hypothetical protein